MGQILTCYLHDEVKYTTYEGQTVLGRVTQVIDGDTLTVVFLHYGRRVKHRVRLSGCDTPEVHPRRSVSHRELHAQAGRVVKDYVQELLLGRLVYLDLEPEDKYGRLLGRVYLTQTGCCGCLWRDMCLNDHLIEKGYALDYYGKTKSTFTRPTLQQIVVELQEEYSEYSVSH